MTNCKTSVTEIDAGILPEVRRRLTWRHILASPGRSLKRMARDLKSAVLPERQIFFRIRSEIDYVTLTPGRQLAMFAGGIAVAGWLAYSTLHVFAFDWMVQRQARSASEAWSAYARVDGERGLIETRAAQLRKQIQDLEVTLAVVQVSQEKLLARVTRQADTRIGETSRLLAMTGLNVDSLMEAAERRETDREIRLASSNGVSVGGLGRGGPFISAGQRGKIEPLRVKVADLEERLVQSERMHKLLKALPLASPVDHYRQTSTFGPRRDPFFRRIGRHNGLDMANVAGTEIFAPGPGEIVFAGWNGRYGRMIEIDHGFGVRTRYGHLQEILVELGDKVAFRQEIAKMGSSGRSTGPHLHYEVLVNGVPTDPGKLLEAGKFFFKTDSAARIIPASSKEPREPGAKGASTGG